MYVHMEANAHNLWMYVCNYVCVYICMYSGVPRGVSARGQGILMAPPKNFLVVQKPDHIF